MELYKSVQKSAAWEPIPQLDDDQPCKSWYGFSEDWFEL